MKLPWSSSSSDNKQDSTSGGSIPDSTNTLSSHPNGNVRTEHIEVTIPESEQLTNYTPGQKILLRDTKPKYSESEQHGETTYEQLMETFSKDDLKPSNMVVVPCFRQAGMLGFSTMFVVGSVMFISLKNIKRASNWAVAGFSIGSIFGWEKCRYQRRKELEIANKLDALQNSVKEKQMKKLKEQQQLAQQQQESENKKWYKVW